MTTLTLVAAIACGVVGGIFFTFSTFVMKALGRLPLAQGAAAMNSINVVAVTPPFMSVLFGTAVLCLGLAGSALFRLDEPGAGYQLAGGLTYLVTIVLTGVYHVPRNNQLAAVDPGSAEEEKVWRRYLVEWTGMNHVRTISPVAAAVLFAIALRVS